MNQNKLLKLFAVNSYFIYKILLAKNILIFSTNNIYLNTSLARKKNVNEDKREMGFSLSEK